jgi:hypothetical protein
MFRQLATLLPSPGPKLFDLHPMILARALEDAWSERAAALVGQGSAGYEPRFPPETLTALRWPDALRPELAMTFTPNWSTLVSPLTWPHAMYGYLIETTNAYEIFRRVLYEYNTGERLGTPTPAGRSWLRATEELFFSPWHPYAIGAIGSEVRPDARATRRNLWWRLFGVDLQHQGPDGRPYPFEKPDAANREFIPVFQDLLREVWRGIENSGNTSGANPTDDNVIVNLTRSLANMLNSRRINGNLAREEFIAVSTMSWFHHTIEQDSPIVVDLRCQATSSAERLRLIGERVGVPAYARSDACLELADPLSAFLIQLENGDFASTAGVQSLYAPELPTPPGGPNPLRTTMTTIITQWSAATGLPMKAPKVEVTSQAGMRTVAQAPAPAPSPTNGNRPVGVG